MDENASKRNILRRLDIVAEARENMLDWPKERYIAAIEEASGRKWDMADNMIYEVAKACRRKTGRTTG